MSDLFTLKEYYVKYLTDVRHVKDSTVNHYIDALNHITRHLVDKKILNKSIYEITEIGELEIIREYLRLDSEFQILDKRGHQMYSAGMNNYYKFASGEGFRNIHNNLKNIDIELPAKELVTIERNTYQRSSIIKLQTIESAGYKCEIDSSHTTFTAKSTVHPYMEGHHAIPMKKQPNFEKSLDVYANVVCLCPICHRLLHFGIDSDKEFLLDKIYSDRVNRLVNSGIRLSKKEFGTLAM